MSEPAGAPIRDRPLGLKYIAAKCVLPFGDCVSLVPGEDKNLLPLLTAVVAKSGRSAPVAPTHKPGFCEISWIVHIQLQCSEGIVYVVIYDYYV